MLKSSQSICWGHNQRRYAGYGHRLDLCGNLGKWDWCVGGEESILCCFFFFFQCLCPLSHTPSYPSTWIELTCIQSRKFASGISARKRPESDSCDGLFFIHTIRGGFSCLMKLWCNDIWEGLNRNKHLFSLMTNIHTSPIYVNWQLSLMGFLSFHPEKKNILFFIKQYVCWTEYLNLWYAYITIPVAYYHDPTCALWP